MGYSNPERTITMHPTVVWTEIPVTDLEKGVAFYSAVFDWKMIVADMGPNKTATFSDAQNQVGGHLYPGIPAPGTGPTVHIALPDTLEDGMARCTAAGGTLVGSAIEIPVGRFHYATDPDGNSIGLFETRAAA